jgi:hypothetical protein
MWLQRHMYAHTQHTQTPYKTHTHANTIQNTNNTHTIYKNAHTHTNTQHTHTHTHIEASGGMRYEACQDAAQWILLRSQIQFCDHRLAAHSHLCVFVCVCARERVCVCVCVCVWCVRACDVPYVCVRARVQGPIAFAYVSMDMCMYVGICALFRLGFSSAIGFSSGCRRQQAA